MALDGTPAHEIGDRLRKAIGKVTDRELGDGVTAARRAMDALDHMHGSWLTEKSIVSVKQEDRTLEQRLALLRHALYSLASAAPTGSGGG